MFANRAKQAHPLRHTERVALSSYTWGLCLGIATFPECWGVNKVIELLARCLSVSLAVLLWTHRQAKKRRQVINTCFQVHNSSRLQMQTSR